MSRRQQGRYYLFSYGADQSRCLTVYSGIRVVLSSGSLVSWPWGRTLSALSCQSWRSLDACELAIGGFARGGARGSCSDVVYSPSQAQAREQLCYKDRYADRQMRSATSFLRVYRHARRPLFRSSASRTITTTRPRTYQLPIALPRHFAEHGHQ